MTKEIETQSKPLRSYPKIMKGDDNNYSADVPPDFCLETLMGMRTHEAANGVYQTAISALGKSAEKYADFASAMFAETEQRDAFEAMLIAQMTAAHVTFTTLSERLSYQTSTQVRESLEPSVTRLNRTYIAQLEALKKHRSKAQQTVRVERVNVESGGQAIVVDVSHGGRVWQKSDASPIQKAHDAPKCTAHSKRSGFLCKSPAVKGWNVCRMHGAGGGQRLGKHHSGYRHGTVHKRQ